jgi:hypothetical protein
MIVPFLTCFTLWQMKNVTLFFLIVVQIVMYPLDRRKVVLHLYAILHSLRKTASFHQVSHQQNQNNIIWNGCEYIQQDEILYAVKLQKPWLITRNKTREENNQAKAK